MRLCQINDCGSTAEFSFWPSGGVKERAVAVVDLPCQSPDESVGGALSNRADCDLPLMAVESLPTLAGVDVVSRAFQRILPRRRGCASAAITTAKEYCFWSKQRVWMLCADCCVSLEPHSNSTNEGKLINESRACILLVFNLFFLFLWRTSVTTTCLQCSIPLGDAGSRETFQPLGCPRLFWMCPRAPLITTFHTRRTLTVCLLQCFFFFLLIQVVHWLLFHTVLCGGTKSSFLFYFFFFITSP